VPTMEYQTDGPEISIPESKRDKSLLSIVACNVEPRTKLTSIDIGLAILQTLLSVPKIGATFVICVLPHHPHWKTWSIQKRTFEVPLVTLSNLLQSNIDCPHLFHPWRRRKSHWPAVCHERE
jgi:hypothetical protein